MDEVKPVGLKLVSFIIFLPLIMALSNRIWSSFDPSFMCSIASTLYVRCMLSLSNNFVPLRDTVAKVSRPSNWMTAFSPLFGMDLAMKNVLYSHFCSPTHWTLYSLRPMKGSGILWCAMRSRWMLVGNWATGRNSGTWSCTPTALTCWNSQPEWRFVRVKAPIMWEYSSKENADRNWISFRGHLQEKSSSSRVLMIQEMYSPPHYVYVLSENGTQLFTQYHTTANNNCSFSSASEADNRLRDRKS